MRLVEVLQLSAAVIGVLATAFMAIETRLVSRLRRAGAVTPETAIEAPPLGALLRWRLVRLEAAGVIVAVVPGRLYFDEAAYKPLRTRRAVRAVSLVVVALALVVLVHTALN